MTDLAALDAIEQSSGLRGRLIRAMCDAAGGRRGVVEIVNRYCAAAQRAHHAGDIKVREENFDALVVILAWAARRRDIDFAAEWLEPVIYNRVIKLTEDDAEVHAKMQRIIPIMTELGWYAATLARGGGIG